MVFIYFNLLGFVFLGLREQNLYFRSKIPVDKVLGMIPRRASAAIETNEAGLAPCPARPFAVGDLDVSASGGGITDDAEGPFSPETARLEDGVFRGNAVDLPDDDPRVRRRVKGFKPEQISVSLSATHDSVWISWITGDFQIGKRIKPLDPKSVASIVRYGRRRHSLHHQATGYSFVYNQLYPFKGLQNYTSGIIHHVRLTGLNPGTKYVYQCGDPSFGMSHIHAFRTMPVSGPQSYPARIAIIGDLGLTYNTTSTVGHMRKNKPDLIVLVGDVTYANMYLTNGTGTNCYTCSFSNSTPIHETYQPRWDYWGRFMEPTVSEIPIMVIEGNHELEQQAEKKTYVSYSSRFAFPSEESGSFSTFYYSFNAGGIHFIMLGGYISYEKSGEQYKWLERDLSNVDRTVTPWLIATWHPPWYSSYVAHYREAECMRVEMEELLYSYGVDVVFNGHVHAYERSNRVYNYSLDPCAPLHITVGDGGNREKIAVSHADDPGHCPDPWSARDWTGKFCAFNFTTGPAADKFCWDRQPYYSAYRESSFGHGILEVKNETYALWTWHRNQDLYGTAGDQIYIVRQPDMCPFRLKSTTTNTQNLEKS
ncbi:purple acid phosphatase 15-like [Asparagus officinalis]|uniref:purple acid phosphatase 15-like n=1 Tax=Asparagus officinalis TaxID=4686 RepID=UPI00098E57EA|nr:purple acid phosphatase 15-like [Asparagus officinalis]